jgi:hypothetical protein
VIDDDQWRAISEDEMRTLVDAQLAQCSAEERSFFERIRIPFRQVALKRGHLREDVFAVAQSGQKVVYYDDVEDGFEVGTPDADGVLCGCGQFELCHALAQIRHGSR